MSTLQERLRAEAEVDQREDGFAYRLLQEAADALDAAERRIKELEAKWNQRHEYAADYLRGIRCVDEPCKACSGAGVVVYANTAMWRGGIGGNAMTHGPCDKCWGSGDARRPWPSWRDREHRAEQAERELAEARAREQRLREALNDVELSDGAFRALCDSYLNPVPVVTADDQKWAAEALRHIGGEPGGGERR